MAYYRDVGAGPPVVLLASMLIRARIYEPTVQALSRRFRVIVLEMPGSGRGSRLPVPWDFEQYARWAASFLSAMGLDQVTLIGHSNSGAVALVMGALHPERIGRLVLVDPVGVDPTHSVLRLLLARFRDLPLEPRFSRRAGRAVLYNLLVHPRNLLSQAHLSATQELIKYAPLVRVPTLLAWGARDHTMPVRMAEVLQRLLPDATLVVSRSGSHDWLVEQPARFAAVVTDFVAGDEERTRV